MLSSMAAALIGRLSPFDGYSESLTAYEESLEQHFIVNEIQEVNKVTLLLTLLGQKTYWLLRNLTALQSQLKRPLGNFVYGLTNIYLQNKYLLQKDFDFIYGIKGPEKRVQEYVLQLPPNDGSKSPKSAWYCLRHGNYNLGTINQLVRTKKW